jgi:hypothetical protein
LLAEVHVIAEFSVTFTSPAIRMQRASPSPLHKRFILGACYAIGKYNAWHRMEDNVGGGKTQMGSS